MVPEIAALSTVEIFAMGLFLLIGAGFILFGRGVQFALVGIIVIGGIVAIAYINHTQYFQKRFTLNAFQQGEALECGLFRGESIRVDPAQGWVIEKESRFVKGDVIINDVGVCNVIGNSPANPSPLLYWLAYVTLITLLMILRSVTLGIEEKNDDARDE